jgi:phenylpropionate dioxygenase-like ring-hydroxylating dioxygenase large terminal subunit
MLSAQDNERLTRVGPGTPMGQLMRAYWQPVGLLSELPSGGAPMPVRVLGEDLVLFRDDAGRPGLLGLHCSHRGADLSYGRVEDGGLRCLYHGWLYDIDGRCLDQPAEPATSRFKEKICHLAYPCVERAGLVFAYLGPGEPPLLPEYEFLQLPESQTAIHRAYVGCNWLQKKEGNLDPAHLSFLHRFFEGSENLSEPDEQLFDEEEEHRARMREDSRPAIEVERAPWGMRIYAIRNAGPDDKFVKITNFVLPDVSTHSIGLSDGYNVLWHVPIDDVSTWEFDLVFAKTPPGDGPAGDEWRERKETWTHPNWLDGEHKTVRNRENRYLQDRDEMVRTYTGMGFTHFVHDAFATEGMGPIADRTTESLGYSDRPIIAMRRILLDALDAQDRGPEEVPHVVRDHAANDFPEVQSVERLIPASVPWQEYRGVFFGADAGR